MRDPIVNLKLQIEFMNLGIVPLGSMGAPIWNDINKVLATLQPDEARKMKRKFRKEWRRIVVRQAARGGRLGVNGARMVGLGLEPPARNHKNSRKQKVMMSMWKKLDHDTMQKVGKAKR